MDGKIIFIFLIIMAKLSCKDTLHVAASRNASSINSTNITNMLNTTNFPIFYVTHGRQYENFTIPLWGFNSTCKWVVATYVDLSLSGMGVVYNAFIFLLPFFFARLYNARGGFMCSYAVGCFLCSFYYVYFDLRVLFVQDDDDVTRPEKGMLYILMLFLAYHVVLHVYLLTWDQYRTVFHCRGHLRYTSTSRLYKIGFIVWVGSIVLPVLETIFFNNISHFPHTYHVSDFRLVCVIIILFFFWFLPLMFMIAWNGDLFCFLLKVIHNGYVVKERVPAVSEYKPELMPELVPCPWFNDDREKGDDISYDDGDDPAELATIPDDTRYEFTRCFVHLVVTTLFASPLLVWLAYHLLAMLRTGNQVSEVLKKQFYETVFNCHVFICLYVSAKLIAILNPLCYFYYRPEIHRIIKCVLPWMSSENITA